MKKEREYTTIEIRIGGETIKLGELHRGKIVVNIHIFYRFGDTSISYADGSHRTISGIPSEKVGVYF